MMTREEVIAEVESSFPQYAESNMIDRILISNYMKKAIKQFGTNVMIKSEAFLEVKNGKAPLPDDYWNLSVAIKCEPYKYEVVEGEHKTLLDSYFYRQRTEETNVWNYTLDAYVPEDTTTIREEFVFNRAKADFHYIPVKPLNLVKSFKRNKCSEDSPYRSSQFAKDSPYNVNIYNNFLQTNFKDGTIYMQYLAMPTTEDGDIMIPDTQHDELQEYVLYFVKRKVLEHLLNQQEQVGNILQYYVGMERDAYSKAMTEVKFGSLKNWKQEYIKRKRLQTLQYERMFPNK